MVEFGKRTVNATRGATFQHASNAPRQSTPDWSDQLSSRDLKALEKGRLPAWANMSRLKLVSLAFLMVAITLGAAAYYGPDVVRDARYAGTFKVAFDLRATEGKCKRYMFLVSLCSVKIESVTNEWPAKSTEFLMSFRSGDGEAMIPVRSSVDASAVGIQYAVSDLLLNRALSLLGIALLFSWVAWFFFDCVRKGRYKDGPAYEAVMQYVALHSRPADAEAAQASQ
jgi:hypothetical protein